MSIVKNIYINSAFRDGGGSDENFTITKTYSSFNKIPRRIKLLSARIPYTWNNVTSNNNALTLFESPASFYNVVIPVGLYNGTSLASILQTTLNAVPGVLGVYTVTYNTTTHKFTVSSTHSFELIFNIPDTAGYILGFGAGTTSLGTTTTSTNATLVMPDNEVVIHSTLIGGIDNGVVPWFPGDGSNSQILAVVPIDPNSLSIIEYTASNAEPWQDMTQSDFAITKKMGFSLSLFSGNPIDLQDNPWSANILLEF